MNYKRIWYKLLNYWRRGDADGDNSAQDRGDGTIDLLFNTLTKIVKDRDRTLWAILSFLACAVLLIQRKRYPNEMRNGHEAKSRVIYYIIRFFRKAFAKVNVKIKQRSRPQHDMTRDPYKALGACYIWLITGEHTEYHHIIRTTFNAVTIPLYLYRPNMWKWWRRLKRDGRPLYRKRMDYFTDLADVMKFEKYDEDHFYQDIIGDKK